MSPPAAASEPTASSGRPSRRSSHRLVPPVSAASQTRTPAPSWLAVPDDANALAPDVWPTAADSRRDGVLRLGGVAATALRERFGTPLYVIDEDEVRAHARRTLDAFRAAAAAARRAGARVLRRQGVPDHRGRPLGDRGGPRGRRLHAAASSPSRSRPAPIPSRLGLPRQQQERRRTRARRRGRRRLDRHRQPDRDRAPRRDRRAPRRARRPCSLRVNSGVHAETHDFLATAHEDQKFGFTLEDAAAAVARIRELDGPGVRRPALPHRLADLRHRGIPGVGGARRRTPRRAARRRRHPRPQPRRRLRHRLHRRRRPDPDRGARRRASPTPSPASATCAASRCRISRSNPAARSSARRA